MTTAPTATNEVLSIWTTQLFQRTWPEIKQVGPAIIEYLYELRGQQTAAIASGVAESAKSSFGLFESDFDLLDLPHDGLRRLRAFFIESIRMVVNQVNGGEVHLRRIQVEFPDSWFHITNDGGFHDTHAHDGCSWCGIFYLQSGDSSRERGSGAENGINRFYSPLPQGGGYRDYGNAYLKRNTVDIPPQDGLLVLFPSYLLHSALAYRGERDRVVIAFNSRSNVVDA